MTDASPTLLELALSRRALLKGAWRGWGWPWPGPSSRRPTGRATSLPARRSFSAASAASKPPKYLSRPSGSFTAVVVVKEAPK